jgi:hypothetical protein
MALQPCLQEAGLVLELLLLLLMAACWLQAMLAIQQQQQVAAMGQAAPCMAQAVQF